VGSVAVETGNRSSDSIAFLETVFDSPAISPAANKKIV